ncbi:E3 ubiquitin-protein ligase RNF181-like [Lytechinus variegatus]|uniref:E3 ubiquitin-protein ligase RNF181-like n=1 Tax=Lytechinus variegatus TaxID=7654 RepID=UPI001BB1060C|nr:E3 ubiquitin-protein ligase RNF181-like [Lytechinus variegatus]
MASYFDEHGCEPTGETGPELNTLLRWARILINDVRQYAEREGLELPPDIRKAPPASKECVANLKETRVSTDREEKCPVCLLPYQVGDVTKTLPCVHEYHQTCILPWLNKTNSCPMCRHELPTDDEDYEEYRKHKARAKQRQFETESLHNAMYS